MMKAIIGAACLIALATGVVACSSGGSVVTAAQPGGGNQPLAAAGSNPTPQPGVPVTSLTCDNFPLADIQAAAQQLAPSATAQATGGQPSGTGSGLECSYLIATPGTDTSSASRGRVDISFTIGDQVTFPEVPADSVIDYTMEKADFTKRKNEAKSQDNGQPMDDERPQYRDLPQPVGDDAYLVDEPHFQSDGTQTDYTTDLWVLRTPRPTTIDVTMSYDMTQLDESPPSDKSLDTVMRDDGQRAKLAMAVAKAVLAKIPTKAH